MIKLPGYVQIVGLILVIAAWGIMPVSAAVCDGPPNSQSFILFTGGCDRSPAVLPCTQGFIFPALPSPGGDFPTQYYVDFGDGSPPYYGTVDGVTHTYTVPGLSGARRGWRLFFIFLFLINRGGIHPDGGSLPDTRVIS